MAAPDRVKAYLWHSLATFNGSPFSERSKEELARKMTSAQVADAETLVKGWKPDPKSCDGAGAPASSS